MKFRGSRIGWRVTVPPLMQFFLDVINGAIDAGMGFGDCRFGVGVDRATFAGGRSFRSSTRHA